MSDICCKVTSNVTDIIDGEIKKSSETGKLSQNNEDFKIIFVYIHFLMEKEHS